MGIARRLATLALVTLLGACAAIGLARLEPGRSTEAEVRAVLGAPAMVFPDADGSRQLVFPRGPEGRQTYMAFVAADGRLQRLEQALTEENFRRLEMGKTNTAQLERLVGPPWRKIDFPNKRQVAWDYVFEDTWGYTVDFSVMVDERGLVAETAYVRRDPGRSGGNFGT